MKKRRVIFVGENNKEGLTPLCSSTKSGKLIDQIIAALPIRFKVLKSNLYTLDYWPYPRFFNWEWRERVKLDLKSDIVVVLGQKATFQFMGTTIRHIKMPHPSKVWSNEAKKKYIAEAVRQITTYKHKSK